jgi:phosphoribosylamine--glycine ligase
MKILVVGSGGREHALVDRLASDPSVTGLLCAPGNPGIAARAACRPLAATDVDALVSLALDEGVSLVVVGPEAPLALGLADRLAERGVPVFGPSAAAARLETSKAFAKDFMARHRIPTAGYEVCRSVEEAKLAAARLGGAPVVIKADGLAAGKGVVVALTPQEASDAIDAALVGRAFGAAGETLVVEEYLEGTEASFFAICDGSRAVAAGSAQDHKRALDGDRGPNTGGMGAFAPSPLVDGGMADRILAEIVEPVIGGMRAEGYPFVGFLYVGLMMTAGGPKVIEFNVRFGDPEAQVVFPLIDGELAPMLLRAARGELAGDAVRFLSGVAVGVVMASDGYPGLIDVGKPITGIERAAAGRDVRVYHSGTALRDGWQIVTAGGRVLTVVARAATYRSAISAAYAAVDEIAFDRAHVRRDIGRRALDFSGEAATR